MKKLVCLLLVGFACVSTALFAEPFEGGGYTGPSIEPIPVSALVDAVPNDFIIVTGTIVQRNVPGIFVLADAAEEEGETPADVLVRIDYGAWVNLEVDDTTPVLIYGIVLKKYMNTEILALRVDFLPEEEE